MATAITRSPGASRRSAAGDQVGRRPSLEPSATTRSSPVRWAAATVSPSRGEPGSTGTSATSSTRRLTEIVPITSRSSMAAVKAGAARYDTLLEPAMPNARWIRSAKSPSNSRSTTRRSGLTVRPCSAASRFAMSSVDSASSASAVSTEAARRVSGWLASPMINGMPCSRTSRVPRADSVLSIATSGTPRSRSCWITRVPRLPRPTTTTCPASGPRREPSASASRALTTAWTTTAVTTGTSATPVSVATACTTCSGPDRFFRSALAPPTALSSVT